jgi:hypothetical protein
LYTDGGLGGLGGLGGEPGNQGARGEGADGTDCENGSSPGELGAVGIPGDKGLQGDEGFGSRLHCSDCPGIQSFTLPSELVDGTIAVKSADSNVSGVINNHGERKTLKKESTYIEVRTEDGTNCASVLSDAFHLGDADKVCQSGHYKEPIYNIRVLDSSTLTFVVLGPTDASVKHKVKEICDVFLSCKSSQPTK